MLIDKLKHARVEKKLHNKKWENNASDIAEVIVLLELIAAIANKAKHISNRKIIIGIDHKKSYDKIVNNMKKTSDYVQEVDAEIVIIKKN